MSSALYEAAAIIVFTVHFLWILFVIFGGILFHRHRTLRWVHGGSLGMTLLMQSFEIECPLTHLEQWLLVMAGSGRAYEGSFIIHYLRRLIYPDIPFVIIRVLTVALAALTLGLYLRPLWGRLGRRGKATA
ncbi:MAG: DUF2784 domain-containing protein [Deltaproteobacteria bacterium]|nr:DUF2784 domain-containing protein [Deltaproteobacteria bacterium]